MSRATLEELAAKQEAASSVIGSYWRHKSGDIYGIILVSIREHDNALLYSYRPDPSKPNVIFTRPADEWRAVPEGETKARYQLVRD